MRALAVVFAFACGCTHGQLRKVHHVSEVTTGGALVGILACGTIAAFDQMHEGTILAIGVVFVPIAILGAFTYVATDSEAHHEVTPEPTQRERKRAAAWELTKEAATAARGDDCTQVQAIAPRVRELDADFYVSVFLRDVAIARCLSPNG